MKIRPQCPTSPLIALSILGRTDLLKSLFGEWVVPGRVAKESTADGKAFSKQLATALEGHIVELGDDSMSDVLAMTLDRGEAEVISLAEHRRSGIVLLDDRKGRRLAAQRGLTAIGTVGLLLRARRSGLVSEVRPLLDRLMSSGIRISKPLYSHALEIAGEAGPGGSDK